MRLIINIRGEIVELEGVCHQVRGLYQDNLVGKSVKDLFAPEGSLAILQYLQCPTHSYGAILKTSYGFCAGTAPELELIVRPVPDNAELYSVTVDEIASTRNTEHRLMLTHYTLDKLADMIIWLDKDARYVFVNEATTRLLGYSAEELRHLRVWDVDPFFDEARWREHWQEIEEKGSFKIETVNTSKAGVDIPIEVTVNLVEYGGVKYNCSIVRDITERKKHEAELLALNKHVFELSITDGLTGLANRRHMDAVMESEIGEHTCSGEPLSIILFDVDAFKAFNDYYGHIEGDGCLRRIGAVVANSLYRPSDLAVRYGGEEFACILPETGERGAFKVANRIREGLNSLAIPHGASPVANIVTASFGVLTTYPTMQCTSHEIFKMVDSYLYRAKREGRNRIAGRELETLAAGTHDSVLGE